MSRLTDQLRAKLDRNELDELQTQIRSIVRKPDAESLEAQLGKVCACVTWRSLPASFNVEISIVLSKPVLYLISSPFFPQYSFIQTYQIHTFITEFLLSFAFVQYGLGVDEAAGMRRPVQRFNCISCDRPITSSPSKTAAPGTR